MKLVPEGAMGQTSLSQFTDFLGLVVVDAAQLIPFPETDDMLVANIFLCGIEYPVQATRNIAAGGAQGAIESDPVAHDAVERQGQGALENRVMTLGCHGCHGQELDDG